MYSTIIGQLTNSKDSLAWSDDDKVINNGRAAMLGNPLSDSYDLFYDLQLKYKNNS